MEQPVIEFRNVEMHFGPKVVLDRVSFSVAKGEDPGGDRPFRDREKHRAEAAHRPAETPGGPGGDPGPAGGTVQRRTVESAAPAYGHGIPVFRPVRFLDVGENVAFGLRQHTSLSEEGHPEAGEGPAGGRGPFRNEHVYPAQLSGGMQKRVGLARALALQPDIILYDEPTAGLDPIMATNISQLILDTKKKLGITSVLVTHDMASAFLCADRILMLSHGHIVFSGTVEEARHTRELGAGVPAQ